MGYRIMNTKSGPVSALMILCFMILSHNLGVGAERHQITGLFSPDREGDLRLLFEKIPEIKLVSIDYKNAEAVLDYPPKLFSGAKAEQLIQRLDNLIRQASNGTFGAKALSSVPLEKLMLIEIPVSGCDCKACSLAVYETVYKLEGVERATASFKEGMVRAWIHPEKTDRAKLEAALRKRQIPLRSVEKD